MSELRHALAIDSTEFGKLHELSDEDDIVHSCGSLVDYNRATNLVTFSHELVRKYVENHKGELLVDPVDIALACLSYRSFHGFKCSRDGVGLNDYAYDFWAAHIIATRNNRSVIVEAAAFKQLGVDKQWDHHQKLYRHGYHSRNSRNVVHSLFDWNIGFLLTKPLPDERIKTW